MIFFCGKIPHFVPPPSLPDDEVKAGDGPKVEQNLEEIETTNEFEDGDQVNVT